MAIDFVSQRIATALSVNANTVYSQEVDLRKRSGYFITSTINTTGTGSTWLEVADVEKMFWSKVPDSTKAISGDTKYCIDMSETQGAYMRQVVQLDGVGTFTTNVSTKV